MECLLLPGLVGGCARYEAMPLNHRTVDQALTPLPANVAQARARELRHPLLAPVVIDFNTGLTPDSAAVLAVIINPTLRAQRDRRSLASAQLLQAGLLPNPQLVASQDFITSGPATINPFAIGPAFDFSSLISHAAKVNAAKASSAAVQLDVAWVEWQTAEAAKTAVYDQVALERQLALAHDVDQRLAQNVALINNAVNQHQKTLLDSAAAEAASQTAHAGALAIEQQVVHQRLVLLRAIGLPPGTPLRLRQDIPLPSRLTLPPAGQLMAELESRRLDLRALRRGYDAQEQIVRAAILQQFPKISIGFNRAEDNTGVHSVGYGVTMDLPIFDRNQGGIAAERATRQQLFDEYVSRIFQARSDLAMLLSDIEQITRQIKAADAALPALRQLVETYRLALDQGNADVLSYYTAQSELSQKEIDVLKLRQQLADSQVAVEIVAGRYLPPPAASRESARMPATAPAARPGRSPATQPGRLPATAPAIGPGTRPATSRAISSANGPATREAQP